MANTPSDVRNTTSHSNWNMQGNYVERIMENAAYTSAHPDDTLVLAGPPRQSQASATNLYPIGMMQAFQASQNKQVIPMQTIGSGRSFFITGKASTTFTVGRLFVKGKNLLRALTNNILDSEQGGIDPTSFDEKIIAGTSNDYVANLDSELFMVPFGLAVLFRDKAHNDLGGFYMELCMLSSFAVGVNSGQNMIMENVQGLCDRVLPYSLAQPSNKSSTWDTAMGFGS